MKELFRGTVLEDTLQDWRGFIQRSVEEFIIAVRSWREDYSRLLEAWKRLTDPKSKAQANAIRFQLSVLYELTVIEALADDQFLPRYGFPIGLLKLRVVVPDEKRTGRTREEDQYRLERPGLLALREYVPGSQLLV